MIKLYALVFCSSFFACAFAIPAMSVVAHRIGLVDKPGGRKRHQGVVPLVGGIAIFFCILCAAALGLHVDTPLLLSLGALLILGIYDDLFDMAGMKKLFVQIGICIFLVVQTGVHIRSLGTLSGNVELLLGDFGIALTIIAMVGLVNAMNMVDGLDGLAGGLSIMALLHLVVAMYLIDRPVSTEDVQLIIVVCGALAAFLIYNLGPTKHKIFLGDSGAMLLGLFLAYIVIKASQTQPLTSTLPTSLVAWIVALPVFETLSLMARRIRTGRSPFSPDRNHLHHLMIDNGFSPLHSLLLILALAGTIFWTGFSISRYGGLISGLIFVMMPMAYYLVIIYPLKMRLRKSEPQQ